MIGHFDDLAQRFASNGSALDAGIDFPTADFHCLHSGAGFFLNALDHRSDFLCRLGRALRQLANFICHDSKSASLLTRACRFDGSIQSQQIGLIGNVFDDSDNFADLLRTLAQFAHPPRNIAGGIRNIAHAGEALLDGLAALACSLGSFVRSLGRLL